MRSNPSELKNNVQKKKRCLCHKTFQNGNLPRYEASLIRPDQNSDDPLSMKRHSVTINYLLGIGENCKRAKKASILIALLPSLSCYLATSVLSVQLSLSLSPNHSNVAFELTISLKQNALEHTLSLSLSVNRSNILIFILTLCIYFSLSQRITFSISFTLSLSGTLTQDITTATLSLSPSVWPDWVIYCTLGNFSKSVAIIILSKLPTFFVKLSKSFIFLVKSFLDNSFGHLANFYWSHCSPSIFLFTNSNILIHYSLSPLSHTHSLFSVSLFL